MVAMAASFALQGLAASRGHTTLPIVCSSSSSNGKVGTMARSLTLHVGETSITMPISIDRARALSSTMEGLVQTFREKQQLHESGGRPKRLKSVEFAYAAGDDDDDSEGVGFELFCNPNAYANAFQAKVLVSVSDGKLSLSAEAQFSAIKADVDGFIASLN